MRWVLLLMAGALCWPAMLGCGPHMTESSAEVSHRHQRQFDTEMRQLREDCEVFLLMDHPSRLSRWQTD